MTTNGSVKRTVMPQRRFPPPWRAEEHDACFIVKDRAGLNLAYALFDQLWDIAELPSVRKLLLIEFRQPA